MSLRNVENLLFERGIDRCHETVRHSALRAAALQVRRARTASNRLMLKRARLDTRAWVVKRRERTRQLIELGGLVAKSGLIELSEDDRAAILGLLVEAAAKLRGENREQQLVLWRRRGKRAFDDPSST